MVVLVSGAQLSAWACPLVHEARPAAAESDPPAHAHHHRAPSEAPPAPDDGDGTSGASECATMLACTTPAAVLTAPALEISSERAYARSTSPDARPAAPPLSQPTPPPRTA